MAVIDVIQQRQAHIVEVRRQIIMRAESSVLSIHINGQLNSRVYFSRKVRYGTPEMTPKFFVELLHDFKHRMNRLLMDVQVCVRSLSVADENLAQVWEEFTIAYATDEQGNTVELTYTID